MTWRLIVFILDSIIFSSAAIVAWLLRLGLEDGLAYLPRVYPYFFVSLLTGPLLFALTRLPRRSFRFFSLREFSHVVAAVSMAVLVTVLIAFVYFRLQDVPRSLPLLHWLLAIIGMASLRLAGRILQAYLHRREHAPPRQDREPVLIVGLNALTDVCLRMLEVAGHGHIHAVGILEARPASRGMMVRHCQVIGRPEELAGILARLSIHGLCVRRVILTMPRQQLDKRARQVLDTLERENMLTIVELPALLEPLTTPVLASPGPAAGKMNAGIPLPEGLCQQVEQAMRHHAWKKRLFDIVGASILGLLAIPVLAICVPLVMFSLGSPAIFWQERPGRKGQPVRVYKLRTMKDGVDESGNIIPDDQRQTAIGNFLRRFHLDELPQLYSILKGDMSFIGPRPLLPIDLPEDMPQWNALRSEARPGLTGWAQINGGKQVDKRDKVVLDAWYLANMSLRLDLYILLKTVEIAVWGERLKEDNIRRAYKDLKLHYPLPSDAGEGNR